MANAKRGGLPPNFNINIPDRVEGPVKIGDYLDEMDAPPPAPSVATPQKRADETKVVPMQRPTPVQQEVAPPADSEGPPPKSEEPDPKKPRRKPKGATKQQSPKRIGPARKQINASPEALSMINKLISHVQTYSVQPDAKASEVFHALVLALYESREFIDFSEVPPRGRWGTPTAKSFPISLKNAFQEAIAVAYKKHRR